MRGSFGQFQSGVYGVLQIWITGSRAQNSIFIHETDIPSSGGPEIQQRRTRVAKCQFLEAAKLSNHFSTEEKRVNCNNFL